MGVELSQVPSDDQERLENALFRVGPCQPRHATHCAILPRMLVRIRLYIQVFGVRGMLTATGRRLRTLFYLNQRFIVLLKPLDSIVESRRPGDLRVEDLEAKHLRALSELNRRRGRPQIDRRFATKVSSTSHAFAAWRAAPLAAINGWVVRRAPCSLRTFADL